MVHRGSSSGKANGAASSANAAAVPENLLPRVPPFLRKLRLILETTPEDVAGWNEAGTVFEILDVRRFASEELVKHFKGTEQTFVRQLHFYGFTKFDCSRNFRVLTKPDMPKALPGAWSFSHPLLLRDSPDLMHNIHRQAESRPGRFGSSTASSSHHHQTHHHHHGSSSASAMSDDESVSSADVGIKITKNTVKQLEATVSSLKSKLDILTSFLEKEGYDPALVLSGDEFASKKQKVEEIGSGLNPTIGMKRARSEVEGGSDFTVKPSSLSLPLTRQTSVDFFLQNNGSDSDEFMDDFFEKDPISLFEKEPVTPFANEAAQPSLSGLEDVEALATSLDHIVSFDGHKMATAQSVDEEAGDVFSPWDDEDDDAEFFGTNIDPDTVAKAVMYIREAINVVKSSAASAKITTSVKSESSSSSSNANFKDNLRPTNSDQSHGKTTNVLFDQISPIELSTESKTSSTNDSLVKKSFTPNGSGNSAAALTLSQMAHLIPKLLRLPQIQKALPPSARGSSHLPSITSEPFLFRDNAVTVSAL